MERQPKNKTSSKVPPSEITDPPIGGEGYKRSSREAFTLHLADNALILGHRNSEWCGHGPILEQDIAITNISLDLIGQARNFYQYAARLINQSYQSEASKAPPSEVPKRSEGKERSSWEASEDSFAYFRSSSGFKNILLVELPKGDWAQTILRQFFFSSWQNLLFEKLKGSNDEQISAIAIKALKEIAYHLRWSSEWVIRLGDGTEESHMRMEKALEGLWRYTEEMFIPVNYELETMNIGTGTDVASLKVSWMQNVEKVFAEAGLSIPSGSIAHTGGKEGKHTEYLDEILAELQSVARAHPTATW